MQQAATKRKITLELQDGGFEAKVEAGTDYAAYLEVGTKMNAQPFMKPAFDVVQPRFITDLRRGRYCQINNQQLRDESLSSTLTLLDWLLIRICQRTVPLPIYGHCLYADSHSQQSLPFGRSGC